jgi:hypothetical protein
MRLENIRKSITVNVLQDMGAGEPLVRFLLNYIVEPPKR